VPERFKLVGLIGLVIIIAHVAILLLLLYALKGQFYRYDLQVVNQLLAADVEVVFVPLAKTIIQKPAQKKPEVKKNNTPKKPVAKKAIPSTQMVAEKKIVPKKVDPVVPKKIEEPKPEPQKIEKPVEPVKPAPAVIPTPVVPIALQPEIIQIGQLEHDALQMQQELQKLVGYCWHPPAGMDDAVCTIKIVIAHDGTVADCSVEKSSGNLIYDTAAKQGARDIAFPLWARGKELGVTFCQTKEQLT